MKTSIQAALIYLIGASAVAPAVAAPKPEKLFQELFGAEARKVQASSSRLDDALFAQKLLKNSRTLTEAPAFRLYLYEKVYEFGIRSPKGYAAAQTALNLLVQSLPNRQEEWDENRLELYKLQYRAAVGTAKRTRGESYITQCMVVGDHKAAKGKWRDAAGFYNQAVSTATLLRSLQKPQAAEKLAKAEQMKRIEQLVEQLEKDPTKTTTRVALVRMYVELDDVPSAAKYVNPTVGEPWRTYVPLAAKPAAGLPTQVCYELGNWYRTLAFSARPGARDVLAGRAKDYYLSYLQKLRTGGATVGQLEGARLKINTALKGVGQRPLPRETVSGQPGVQRAMDKAIAYLWSQQVGLGSWPVSTSSSYTEGYYNTRPTAQVMLALMGTGVKLRDKRLSKALRYLETRNTPRTEGIALRAMVWEQAYRQRGGLYHRRLGRDVNALIVGTTTGGYYYRVDYGSSSSQNCYSWSPPMGVAAGARQRVRVPRKYWQVCLTYWTKQQKADGGWAYQTTSTASSRGKPSAYWTTAGLATCALCLRQLYGPEAVRRMSGSSTECLRKGFSWMDKNFRGVVGLRGDSSYYLSTYRSSENSVYAGLWHLSRLGLLTGRRKIADLDWYRVGCEYLLSTQGADGSWGDPTSTARAILFLVNGRKLHDSGIAAVTPVTPIGRTGVVAETDPVKRIARKKADVLKERLKTKPDSTTIPQELVRLYVVELEEPASAVPYADKTGQKGTPRLVALASQDAASLSQAQCLNMAQWYVALTEGSSKPGRRRALSQAITCYKRFLTLHRKGDAARLKAKLGLQKAESLLGEIKD